MTSTCHRLFKNMSRAKRLGLATMATMGVTYWYYKPARNNPVPPVPYIPPLFVWESIPKPIRKRFATNTITVNSAAAAQNQPSSTSSELKPTILDKEEKAFFTIQEEKDGIMWRFMTATVIGSIGTLSKLFLGYFNDTKVHGLEQFLRILQDPQRKKGILTVSNHESVLDDPVLWGVLPLSVLFSPERMRWVLGAADICYTSVFRSYFFVFGQTIPTIRGAGIYQPALDFSIHHLQKKGWVHIYPEAKVSQDNNGKMIRFKWGIGRILMDSSNAVSADTMSNSKEIDGDNREPVIVIPIWHKGMHLVKPLYGTKLAHVGKPITIVYGDPVSYGDILDSWKLGKLTREEARIELTQRVYDAIEKLQKEYDNNTANSL